MALSYLLDEHISKLIVDQIRTKRSNIPINSVHYWRNGAFLAKPDGLLLQAAAQDNFTLVTYDRRTIPPLLAEWAAAGKDHAGVLFVDEKTIREGDIGTLVLALIDHWDQKSTRNWENVIDFLRSPRSK